MMHTPRISRELFNEPLEIPTGMEARIGAANMYVDAVRGKSEGHEKIERLCKIFSDLAIVVGNPHQAIDNHARLEAVAASLKIANTRFSDIDRATLGDTVVDNLSSARSLLSEAATEKENPQKMLEILLKAGEHFKAVLDIFIAGPTEREAA